VIDARGGCEIIEGGAQWVSSRCWASGAQEGNFYVYFRSASFRSFSFWVLTVRGSCVFSSSFSSLFWVLLSG